MTTAGWSARCLGAGAIVLFALVAGTVSVAHATGRSFTTTAGAIPHPASGVHGRSLGPLHIVPGVPGSAIVPGHGARSVVPSPVVGDTRRTIAPGVAPSVRPPRGHTVIITPGAPTLVVVPGHRGTPVTTVIAAPQRQPVSVTPPAGKGIVAAPGSTFLAAPRDGFIAVPNRGFIVAPGDAPVFVGPPGTQRAKILTP